MVLVRDLNVDIVRLHVRIRMSPSSPAISSSETDYLFALGTTRPAAHH